MISDPCRHVGLAAVVGLVWSVCFMHVSPVSTEYLAVWSSGVWLGVRDGIWCGWVVGSGMEYEGRLEQGQEDERRSR